VNIAGHVTLHEWRTSDTPYRQLHWMCAFSQVKIQMKIFRSYSWLHLFLILICSMVICRWRSQVKFRINPMSFHLWKYIIYNTYIFCYVANFFLDQSIGVVETNTFQLKFFIKHKNFGRHRFSRLVGVRVGVANFYLDRYWRDQYISVKIFYLA